MDSHARALNQMTYDFVFASKRALVKNETHECSREALSASEGAKGQQMATAAQNLYDKCPHALRQAMDTLDYNKEAQGYRVIVLRYMQTFKLADTRHSSVFSALSPRKQVPRP